MATLVLSAAGAAIGGAFGGSVLGGISAVSVGRLAGALVGNAIDQRIMGQGADAVETGRIDRYRINGASEGRALARVYGRMRVGGQVIWASRFTEHVSTSGGGGGGKGSPSQAVHHTYSYSVSLALALCEGEISNVSRVWADGQEIASTSLNMRVYPGTHDQLPDPKLEAVEGEGAVPAFRGTAYVIIEDLDLTPYGNRIPQFSFEVSRPSPVGQEDANIEPSQATQAVALIPGTGEYALATSPVYYQNGPGSQWPANLNAPSGQTDFVTATEALTQELPNCQAASLIVSWFGNDLRCGSCDIRPLVEKADYDGSMPWTVAGGGRSAALAVPVQDDRPVYGGTPADASVLQSIAHMKAQGLAVMYYPFILMDQLEGNGLADPWSDSADQPVLPWRGRITLSEAPGQPGSPDGTSTADTEVAAFFGTARASDFTVENGSVTYTGPQEWKYNRFILHQAALCAAAGGVDSFCIGSEMRSLTWIRGSAGQFVAVHQLVALAAEVRSLLGPDVKIGYAADWSEYFGYQPQDGSGDRYFHLDPLWADTNIDFIGIDNYMPLSDWREGEDHADAEWESLYALDYLQANIEGGEGYDWYYHSPEAEAAQIRTDITDGAHDEPWIYRYKDIRNWWLNDHHERINGTRQAEATAWIPQSKPIWFTELGCAAIDKATNQPNKFLDPKSSESTLPKFSNGMRDEYIQLQYLKAMYAYWGDETHNPVSAEYNGAMIDMSRAFVWAWDTRPFPRFPRNDALWSDGVNFDKGHWISGRSTHRSLSSVVREICERAGLTDFDVSDLHGVVRGYIVEDITEPRKALQPLILHYGFDAIEREGKLLFKMRGANSISTVTPIHTTEHPEVEGPFHRNRMADAEMVGRVRVNFIEALGDFAAQTEEAVMPGDDTPTVSHTEMNLSLLRGEGRQAAEKWLAESRIAQDTVRFALPLSMMSLGAGDVIALQEDGAPEQRYRIDQVELGTQLLIDAVRVEQSVYDLSDIEEEASNLSSFVPPVPVQPLFMDLPLLTGDEHPHAPHLAIAARPWPGTVAVYDSSSESNFALNQLIPTRATVGVLESELPIATPGLWDRGAPLQVRLISGALESISEEALLNGVNVALIGDGTPDNWEVIQFQTAELSANMTYQLSMRLRGQAGTDALGQSTWPVGSWFVLLDGIPDQISLKSSLRDVMRHFRIGPAQRPLDDASYVEFSAAFKGNGLRPYAPAHLRTSVASGGDVTAHWIRRTRIDGDRWDLPEVPLGEESESYRVQVWQAGELLRTEVVNAPEWTYSASQQAADGASGFVELNVAQVSARYGAGLSARHILQL